MSVLVVEDYPLTRKMIRVALQAEGFTVREAASAAEAIALARQHMPDLIIQDLGLPDMDGGELQRMLRALPGGKAVPIVACSGRASSLDEQSPQLAGFNDFLVKPVEPAHLIEVVRAQLRKPTKEPRPIGAGQHVIVADDNPVQRKLARRCLEDLGFQVETAIDGMDALDKVRARPPDAILADVMMPRLDGFQLCLCVRRDAQLRRIPVLLHSTANVNQEHSVLARHVGAYSLLTRTPSWRDLGPILAAAISAGAPEIQESGAQEIDSAYFQRVIRQLETQAAENLTLSRRHARQSTHLALLRSVSDALRSSNHTALPLQEVLMLCLDAAGVSRGALLQATPAGPYRILATSGIGESEAGVIADSFATNKTLRSACRTGATVPLSMRQADTEESRELLSQTGAGSALLVPIQADNPDKAAVLWLMSSGQDFGDADSIDFARSLADQLGQALTLGRAFARVTDSEERYRQLVEAIEGIIWEADATTGRFTYVSPYAELLLGYSAQQWIKDAAFWEKLIHPDDRVLNIHHNRASYSESKSYSSEYRVIAADGRVIWLHDQIRVVPGPDGSVRRLRGMMVDITDRKRIEEERAERLRLSAFTTEVASALASGGALRDVLHACCEAMARHLHAAVARIFTHDAATSMLELQASAGILVDINDLFMRVPRNQYMVGIISETGQPYMTNDLLHHPRFADPAWGQREGVTAFAGSPMIIDGRLAGVLAVFAREPLTPFATQALTAAATSIAMGIERRLAEERLAEHRRRLDTFTKVAPLALYAAQTDGEGKLLWVSDSIERISGFPARRFTDDAQHWRNHIHPEDRESVQQAFADIGERGVITVEYRWLCADGKYRVLLDQATRVQGAAGGPDQLLGSWLDVTLRRDAEQALHERDEQLRQTQKMDSIGRLAGGVAHDFNNLLSIILGYSDLALLTMTPADPLYSHISEIQAAGTRASTLTRQLLAFSRKQVLEPQIVNINQVVSRMEQMLHRLIGEDIQLLFERAEGLGAIRADPGQFEQVLLNLAVNARDAMPTGGSLIIRTANVVIASDTIAEGAQIPPGEYVTMAVLDTGCGMNELVRSRLFEPFFTTKDAGQGTGLGLSTVYGIIRQSGGHIRVETAVGKGSMFQVFFPRIEDVQPKPGTPPESRSKPVCTETVLLVEDADAVRRLSFNLLRGLGYHLLEAASGAEALRVSEQYKGPIHLLVTDVIMPNMSGRELAERLTQLRPSIRTLYVSGYTDDSVVRHGLRQERVRFLQKPFTLDALAAHVRKALDSPLPKE